MTVTRLTRRIVVFAKKPTTGSATFSDASVENTPIFSQSLSLSKAYDVRSARKTTSIRPGTCWSEAIPR
jgi:hypothetical protein